MSKTTTFEAWAVIDRADRFLKIGDHVAFYPSRNAWMEDYGARPVRVTVEPIGEGEGE